VRWQGTASAADFLQFNHSAVGAFDPTIHAPVTPGLTYTTSVGFRLVSGTAPSNPTFRAMMINSSGNYITGASLEISNPTATLQRNAIVATAVANTSHIVPNIYWPVGNGAVVDFTVRFYAANVELGVGNARPLLQRNVPETVAAIGELDAEALLNFVGNGNGFITILHDKSGNGRNATQTTPNNQPRIVSNGAMITAGGRPAVLFDGVDDYLAMTSPLNSNDATIIAVSKLSKTVEDGAYILGSQTPIGLFGYDDETKGVRLLSTSGGYFTSPLPAAVRSAASIDTITITSNVAALRRSGALIAGSVSIGQNFQPTLIGAYASLLSRYWGGTISGITLFGSSISTTDRQLIERNRGAYYGIPIT
jgi:hypothetical protein